jgi:transcription-repair coupling factor (superfamily II helicase)
LESRITKFYNQEVPLLISTNIIENGLDLPHVNTIIVYRSHIFSLAGIYQLRGRVGRSSKRGYAYLTYNEKEMTENARKRLNVINSFDKIGSGFNIATQDLDLRGGGSIIGEEQSGFIKEVGTELYHQMLEEEILRQKNQLIKDNKVIVQSSFQPIIRIPEEIFIPDEFINDLDIKMSVYKRISLITNNQERNNLMTELVDRFGKLPNEVENLFKLIEIKILCLRNNIEQIDFGRKGILFGFYKNIPKNPEKILKIGLSKDRQITIRSDQKVFYDFLGNMNDNRFALVKNIIKKFH